MWPYQNSAVRCGLRLLISASQRLTWKHRDKLVSKMLQFAWLESFEHHSRDKGARCTLHRSGNLGATTPNQRLGETSSTALPEAEAPGNWNSPAKFSAISLLSATMGCGLDPVLPL